MRIAILSAGDGWHVRDLQRAAAQLGYEAIAVDFRRLSAAVAHGPELEQEADFIVADGPGSNTETSRALLLRADLAIVPCKASMLEVRALAQATKALKHAQDIRKGQPQARIVLSMVGKTYRLTQDMKDAASTQRLRMAKTAITLKQIYADA